MNIAALDLNLFVVLRAVLDTGSATAAARHLNVTQSAVSNALNRLRAVLGDPLFVRTGRGLKPTARCEALRPAVESALSALEAALEPEVLDAATVERTFTLACADSQMACEVPALVATMSRHMPRSRLRVVSVEYSVANRGLETGAVDAALGPAAAVRPPRRFVELYREDGVIALRRDHPALSGRSRTAKRVGKRLFNQLGHIEVAVGSGGESAGQAAARSALRAHGLMWNPAAVVPHFIAAAFIAARTDLAALLPRGYAAALAGVMPLRVLELPAPLVLLTIGLIWHRRADGDRAAALFRDLVRETLSRAPATRAT